MKIKKDKGIFVRITDKEAKRLEVLKTKHSINISAFFRKTFNDLYEKLETEIVGEY